MRNDHRPLEKKEAQHTNKRYTELMLNKSGSVDHSDTFHTFRSPSYSQSRRTKSKIKFLNSGAKNPKDLYNIKNGDVDPLDSYEVIEKRKNRKTVPADGPESLKPGMKQSLIGSQIIETEVVDSNSRPPP